MGRDGRQRSAGQRRAAKVKARKRRLVESEAAREQHAQLVVERSGDPRFVQQEGLLGGGRKISWDPSRSPAGAGLSAALGRQYEAFRAKFGRDFGPDDPIFFDPDSDVPMPMSPDRWHAALDELIDRADEIGVDRAYLKAWRELGYVVTEQNRHLFSAADIEAWQDAVEEYWPEEDGDLDNDDIDDMEFSDLVVMLADSFEQIVARTLQEHSPRPARDFAAHVMQTDLAAARDDDDDEGDDARLGVSAAFAVLAAWLAGAREQLDGSAVADTVLRWVSTNLGEEYADVARPAGGILEAEGTDMTVQELADVLQDDFLPALTWLAAGVAAEFGDGNAHWLRQHDPYESNDAAH